MDPQMMLMLLQAGQGAMQGRSKRGELADLGSGFQGYFPYSRGKIISNTISGALGGGMSGAQSMLLNKVGIEDAKTKQAVEGGSGNWDEWAAAKQAESQRQSEDRTWKISEDINSQMRQDETNRLRAKNEQDKFMLQNQVGLAKLRALSGKTPEAMPEFPEFPALGINYPLAGREMFPGETSNRKSLIEVAKLIHLKANKGAPEKKERETPDTVRSKLAELEAVIAVNRGETNEESLRAIKGAKAHRAAILKQWGLPGTDSSSDEKSEVPAFGSNKDFVDWSIGQ